MLNTTEFGVIETSKDLHRLKTTYQQKKEEIGHYKSKFDRIARVKNNNRYS